MASREIVIVHNPAVNLRQPDREIEGCLVQYDRIGVVDSVGDWACPANNYGLIFSKDGINTLIVSIHPHWDVEEVLREIVATTAPMVDLTKYQKGEE